MHRNPRLNKLRPVLPLPGLSLALPLALFSLLIGLAAFAAISIFAAGGASAQDAASFNEVRTRAAPTLSATVDERGIVLSWTFDAGNPTGWKVKEFAFLRRVGWESFAALSSTASGPDRTFVDGLDTATKNKYWEGTDLTYTTRAVYERLSDGVTIAGTQSNNATVEGAYTTSQVRAGHEPTNVTVSPHATHVLVEWEFDAENDTPPGWKLIGFAAGRYLSSNIHDVTMFLPLEKRNQNPKQRRVKDYMTGVPEKQRSPGFEWNYGVLAYFERLASGTYGTRKQGNAVVVVFTAPKLPNVRNFAMSSVALGAVDDHLTWDHPNPAWDSSTGLDTVTGYTLNRIGDPVYLAANITRYRYAYHCINYHWEIRSQYGLFFSGWLRPADYRGCS